MSLTALSIDTMLPALPAMGKDLQVRQANDVQLIISTLIMGLSLGQLFFGPLSDSLGRKPALIIGIFLFMVGCAFCLLSERFALVLTGRVIQGIGASGPRLVVVALIRDRFEGRTMAKVMSSIMSIFIVIPAVAPAIGQGILMLADWRSIFDMLLVLAIIVLVWFVRRQPETLMPDHRIPFSVSRVIRAFGEVCRNRISIGYTLVAGLILGAFIGYLNSAQQIFQEIYGMGALFPIYFGGLALSLGCASYFNARIVMRFGTRKIVNGAMRTLAALSVAYTAMIYLMDGFSDIWLLTAFLVLVFFCIGLLFGNLNAIAMKPMGHIAGTASAVVGALSSIMAVPLAVLIGRYYDGTILPLISGFAFLSTLSLFVVHWADRSPKNRPPE
jgi:DHA1 family bicyclomycin/chloramphenicol resistance-like MFS transporter